jgi:hypothetical protein
LLIASVAETATVAALTARSCEIHRPILRWERLLGLIWVTSTHYRLVMASSSGRPLESHDALIAALREIDGLRDKGKVHPAFHFRSRAFLHFHVGPDGRYADVRFGDEWEPVPAATPEERAVLLDRVRRHVASRG